MIEALANTSTDVRCAAAEALGKIGDIRAVEPLIGVLQSNSSKGASGVRSDDDVRCAAAEALGKIGDIRAVEPLIGVVQSNSREEVRQAAASALMRFKDARVVRILVGWVSEPRLAQPGVDLLQKVCDTMVRAA